ncbi:hypothetical protein KY289_001285 [Solanum tuberosum]|nr:hypothetical protein KY289_001285 [Solanum tuberosum]
MNIDGAFRQGDNTASIGGVIRNHKGDWITGFFYKSMAQNHTTAEIEAFHTGLMLADSLKLGNLEIETDLSEILQLMDHAKPPYDVIISVCRSLLKKLQNPVVRHSYRQGNYVADILAKQAPG